MYVRRDICQQKIERTGKTNDQELGKAVIIMPHVVSTNQSGAGSRHRTL